MTKDCYHGDFKTRENPKEPLFIISDDMIRQWRGACIKVAPFQEEDQCKDCEYRGKGARKGCCDFDDDAMEKIFRSRPYNPEQEKQAAINGVLLTLQENLSQKRTLQQAMSVQNEGGFVWWSDIETAINDIRQQTGQTSAEQQRGRGV